MGKEFVDEAERKRSRRENINSLDLSCLELLGSACFDIKQDISSILFRVYKFGSGFIVNIAIYDSNTNFQTQLSVKIDKNYNFLNMDDELDFFYQLVDMSLECDSQDLFDRLICVSQYKECPCFKNMIVKYSRETKNKYILPYVIDFCKRKRLSSLKLEYQKEMSLLTSIGFFDNTEE